MDVFYNPATIREPCRSCCNLIPDMELSKISACLSLSNAQLHRQVAAPVRLFIGASSPEARISLSGSNSVKAEQLRKSRQSKPAEVHVELIHHPVVNVRKSRLPPPTSISFDNCCGNTWECTTGASADATGLLRFRSKDSLQVEEFQISAAQVSDEVLFEVTRKAWASSKPGLTNCGVSNTSEVLSGSRLMDDLSLPQASDLLAGVSAESSFAEVENVAVAVTSTEDVIPSVCRADLDSAREGLSERLDSLQRLDDPSQTESRRKAVQWTANNGEESNRSSRLPTFLRQDISVDGLFSWPSNLTAKNFPAAIFPGRATLLKFAVIASLLGVQPFSCAWAGPESQQTSPFDLGDLSDIQSGFASAFLLILFSEIGDKTFFIAALLATRKSSLAVFSGTFGALAIMTVISVFLGRVFHYIDGILPRFGNTKLPLDDIAAVILLVFFGVSTLLEASSMDSSDAGEEQQEAELAIAGVGTGGAVAGTVVATFALVFVAEWGDKSFFSTIALAAASSPFGVVTGAIVGHGAATVLAVLGGSFLGNYISEKVISYIGGVLFLSFAGITLFEIFS